MRRFLVIVATGLAALYGGVAFAQGTVQLPNGVTVPYYGQAAPTFQDGSGGPYSAGTLIMATDPLTSDRYFYLADGTWVGTQSRTTGLPLTGLPTSPSIPTSVTLPNGQSVSYTGNGIPVVGGQGPEYFIADPVLGTLRYVYSDESGIASSSSTGGWYSSRGAPLTGSTSFGGSSGGGSSSFGVTSGSPGGSSGLGGTSGCLSSSSASGGSTPVPEPGAFALFGFGAAALLIARRRRKRDR